MKIIIKKKQRFIKTLTTKNLKPRTIRDMQTHKKKRKRKRTPAKSTKKRYNKNKKTIKIINKKKKKASRH